VQKKITAIFVILAFGFLGAAASAQQEVTPPPEVAGTAQAAAEKTKEDDRLPIHKQDEWQFFLSPYMWITGMNGNVSTLKNTTTTAIPWWETASVLFSKAIGIMGRAEVWKGRWGFYLDGYYTYMGSSGSGGR
jgi:hypothetical protein